MNTMSKIPLISTIYNPQNQTKERLIDSFVVRLRTFKNLFNEIDTAKMEVPEQHHLIIGKRGLGKTTLLLRLAFEVEQSEKLNTWLIPIVFNEEEYSIRKLYKFWIRIAELLEEKHDLFFGISQKIDTLSEQYNDDDEFEKAIFKLLTNRLKTQKKKIILFIDNVGDMFNKFSDLEAHRLRKILQTSTDIRIFAASSKFVESFFQYNHPFYEFFKITQLEGLNQKETEKLLLKLGELYGYEDTINLIIKKQKGRIEGLRRLTGGVIRTIVLLFEIFIDDKNGSAFIDLEGVLDRVTPLYKHRMDDLSKQQQEIVEAIALSWSAINVKEIKQKTRMESKMISAQLTHLVKNGIINRIPTTTKNHLYQINERFFNIWYLMRCGRKGDKKGVIWLVKFFELWCKNEKDLVDRVKKHIDHLRTGKYDIKAAYYVTEALAAVKHLPSKEQHELIETARNFLKEKNSSLCSSLSLSDIELLDKIEVAFDKTDIPNLLSYHLKLKDEIKFYLLGVLHEDIINDIEKAEEYYLKATKTRAKGNAFFKLGEIYEEKGQLRKAEEYYLLAHKENNAEATLGLGFLYYSTQFEDLKKARKYFEKSEENGSTIATAMLGFVSQELRNFEIAESYFLKALKDGDKEVIVPLAIKNKDAKAAHQLAHLYQENDEKKSSEIEKLFKKAIQFGDESTHSCLGSHYYRNDNIKKAVFHYKKVESFSVYANIVLGIIYVEELEKYNEAEKTFMNAIELANEDVEEREQHLEGLTRAFMFLLQREKYKELLKIFNDKNSNLKTEFQPIYYTLMYYLQDEYPNEYLRMGEELKETVEEIIAEIEEEKTSLQLN